MTDQEFLQKLHKRYEEKAYVNDEFFKRKITNTPPLIKWINENSKVLKASVAVIAVFVFVLLTTYGYTDNYNKFGYKEDYKYITDKALYTAFTSGYIQHIDSKYQYHDRVGIKVDSISMDNNVLYLTFDFKFKDKIPTNISRVKFMKTTIYYIVQTT